MKGQLLKSQVKLAKKGTLAYSEPVGATKIIRRVNKRLTEVPV